MKRISAAVVVGVVVCLALAQGRSAHALNVFQIGNSFTFDTRPIGTEAMLAERLDEEVNVGYHVRGSQTLQTIWNNPDVGGTETVEEYGDYTEALPNNDWDYLTLQSFPSGLRNSTLGKEIDFASRFIDLADSGGGGDTQVILHGPWAGATEPNWDGWNDPVVDDPSTRAAYSAAYQELLYDKLEERYPGRVRLASVGRVIRRIRDEIAAGTAPIDSIVDDEDSSTLDLYRDGIHLSFGVGRFVGSTAIQIAILGHSTVGQAPIYGETDWNERNLPPDVARWIQLITWEVMLGDSRSGVTAPAPGDFDGNGVVDEGDLAVWSEFYGSTSRLLADANGDGVVDAADYTAWRDASTAAVAIGTPEPAAAASAVFAIIATAVTRRRRG